MNNTPSFDAVFQDIENKNILVVTTTWNKDFLAPAIEEIALHAKEEKINMAVKFCPGCLLYTSPSPRDDVISRMPSSA